MADFVDRVANAVNTAPAAYVLFPYGTHRNSVCVCGGSQPGPAARQLSQLVRRRQGDRAKQIVHEPARPSSILIHSHRGDSVGSVLQSGTPEEEEEEEAAEAPDSDGPL